MITYGQMFKVNLGDRWEPLLCERFYPRINSLAWGTHYESSLALVRPVQRRTMAFTLNLIAYFNRVGGGE
jgi:hypothetical protein